MAFINHLGNFVLPAFCLATLLLLVQRVLARKQTPAMRWWRQWMWLFGSGVAVLLLGLLVLERDGKMLTYVALTVVMGLVQFWLTGRKRSATTAP